MVPPKKINFPIEIYNLKIELNVDESDTLYCESVARELDQRMRLIAQQSSTVDTSKLAILTALNILDELNRVKDKKDDTGIVIEKKIDEIISLLDVRAI